MSAIGTAGTPRIERRTTVSRGHRLSYLVSGQGEHLVLVSGMGQRASDWVEDGYVQALSERYRVLVPDLLGVGESDKPHDPDAYKEPGVALDILSVLDAEGVDEPVRMWGYSRGMRLAFIVALEAPERVDRIVGGGTSLIVPPEAVTAFFEPLVAPMKAGDWQTYWSVFGPSVRDLDQRRRFETSVDTRAAAALMAGAARSPYGFDLARATVPALLYVAEDDMFAALMPHDAAALGAELILLSGLDHGQGYLRRDLIEPAALRFLA
jgi:pimeloyl-ACP methyl ester carboxylesterase